MAKRKFVRKKNAKVKSKAKKKPKLKVKRKKQANFAKDDLNVIYAECDIELITRGWINCKAIHERTGYARRHIAVYAEKWIYAKDNSNYYKHL